MYSSLGTPSPLQKKESPPEGYYNLEKMLTGFIAKGGNVRACGTCLKARGLSQEDLVEGVKAGTMMVLADWVKESQKVLSF